MVFHLILKHISTTTGGTSYNSNNILTSQYVYNATNVRLRELSFGYTFRNLFGANKNLTASTIGRNLSFFYKDAPMDPDVAAGTGNGWQGGICLRCQHLVALAFEFKNLISKS